MRARLEVAVTLAFICAAGAGCVNEVETVSEEGPLAHAFRTASEDTGVPRELLLAIGYVETRWHQPDVVVVDDEHGRNATGLMGLVDRPDQPWLARGAALTGADVDAVRDDPGLSIRAAAFLLKELAGGAGAKSLAGWRDAVGRYGAGDDVEVAELYASDVYRVIDSGARGTSAAGEVLVLEGRGKSAPGAKSQALVGDSPFTTSFLAARNGHWHAGRSQAVDRVVIHTTEGSYAGAISWFRSPNNPYQTSAHYVIRSSDGEITQMVREGDTAYHVLNWNSRSVGIEHEAISAQAHWFTDAMYRASAALTRDICQRWGIPMDRAHIVGHVEVPGNDHTDPGVHWSWAYYMDLVWNGDAPFPGGGGAGGGCDGLDYAGNCDGSTLSWCEGGAPRSVSCAASGQVCGWQNDAIGNNCLAAPPSDPCGGLDYAGACDGATLRWCESGSVRTHDCAGDGQVCGWQDDATGNNCLAAPAVDPGQPEPQPESDPCGGLDYAGVCDGALLSWCEDGAPRTFDCASTGEVCGWESDAVGHNCVAPPPIDACGGETYFGRCEGNTLIWCENDVVHTYQCGACGWQDDAVGNNCL